MTKQMKNKIAELGVGAILWLVAFCAVRYGNVTGVTKFIFYVLPYSALTFGVCWEIIKRIQKFRFFDENFLMLLATFGAMLIGKYSEAVGAMLFFQIGMLLEELSMNRTKKSIAKYMDIRPEYANRLEGEKEEKVEPSELSAGNIIVIRPGERIPVDAIVIDGISTIDMKALTGESEPQEVKNGDRVYSGSINLGGVIQARVLKVYADSMASRILKMVEDANSKKSESEKFASRLNRFYTPTVILVGILVMILPPMMLPFHDTEVWMYRGLIFLVAACPFGLLVSVPLALLGGVGAASKLGIMIKGGHYLELLAKTETVIFDKTGTLTEGVFHVQKICPLGISEEELLEITAYGEAYSNHPIAYSLREAYGQAIITSRVKNVKEHHGFGVEAVIDGKNVLIGNSKFMKQQGMFYFPVDSIGSAVHVAVDEEYRGYILIADVIRKDAFRAVRWLNRHHFDVAIFTGDNDRVAENVAKRLKIDSVYANLMPGEKVEALQDFFENQMENEKLAFVGDGINDAPVLARADVGIAMGGLGADAALEAADIILMEDEPSKIISAIRIAKVTMRAIRQNIIFAIGIKLLLLVLAFFGTVTMKDAIIADMVVMAINILNSFWILKFPG